MSKPGDKVQVFKDAAGEWRWRMRARNSHIIATSGEGYRNRSHALRMAERVTGLVPEVIEP